jgi:linoleoyl-CoA desaturase
MGFVVTLIGFNVMHDGVHASWSKNATINKILSYSMVFLGSSAKIRKVKHNVLHHTYTNIPDYDNDIEASPVFRFHSEQKRHWFHAFQFIYWPIFYVISVFQWLFFRDFVNYFRWKYSHLDLNFTVSDHILFWLSKLRVVCIYIIIPSFIMGPSIAIRGTILTFSVLSIFMNVVFQLAHMVEKTQTPALSPDHSIANERAVHEVLTTANFAMRSKLATRLFWWLNFQIEHHLFPHISHIHYPKISHIVQDTCKEFGVRYSAYKTFRSALWSHIKHLWNMGKATSQ